MFTIRKKSRNRDFAETVRQMQIELDGKLDEMEQAVAESVEAMATPDKAANSALETIQAFIDKASDMEPWVKDACARLGKTAAESLGLDASTMNATVIASIQEKYGLRYLGYATGTDGAPPGWAWVGERGPELMYFHGGETVLPAEASREFAVLNEFCSQNIPGYAKGTNNASAFLGTVNSAYGTYHNALLSYGNNVSNALSQGDSSAETITTVEAIPTGGGMFAPITVEVHIHLEGNVPPETVQALEDYVRRGEIQEVVEDALENIRIDAARGVIRMKTYTTVQGDMWDSIAFAQCAAIRPTQTGS